MLTYVVRRLLYSILVLVLASMIIFTFVSVSGDPLGYLRTRPNISQQTIQNIEERNHLNDSVPVRYGYWVRDAFTNEFGNTLQLVFIAEILAVLIAVLIGVLSALRQYSVFDYSATTFSFIGLAMPVFWLALMLQVLVTQVYQSTGHNIFPITSLSSVDPGTGLHFVADRAWHLTLPVLVLMIASIATYSRYMRASMLEVINADYVRTARAKGVSERNVTGRHAFRNALIPLVTLVAINFGALFGGAVVTETVFALDGMGLYFIRALNAGDPYPVMAWLMITATIVILFNLIADIAYGYLDPRVRYD
jgi:peptide/nickel transport system permease protein